MSNDNVIFYEINNEVLKKNEINNERLGEGRGRLENYGFWVFGI